MSKVTVRYDCSAAETEEAIRQKLIELGWAPPGENEPIAWMYDFRVSEQDEPIRDWISKSKEEVFDPRNGYFNIRPLYTTPPKQPLVTVIAESLYERTGDIKDINTMLVARDTLQEMEERLATVGHPPPLNTGNIEAHREAHREMHEDLRMEKQSDAPIYFMRDDHSFRRLSEDVSTALTEIEQEFNSGWSYGSLCSNRKGFQMVHAHGPKSRLEFFAECKKALEAAMKAKSGGRA